MASLIQHNGRRQLPNGKTMAPGRSTGAGPGNKVKIMVKIALTLAISVAFLAVYFLMLPSMKDSLSAVTAQPPSCTIGYIGRSTTVTLEGAGTVEFCLQSFGPNDSSHRTYIASAEPLTIPVVCEFQSQIGPHVRVRQANTEIVGDQGLCSSMEKIFRAE
jgi:hypothetical protein